MPVPCLRCGPGTRPPYPIRPSVVCEPPRPARCPCSAQKRHPGVVAAVWLTVTTWRGARRAARTWTPSRTTAGRAPRGARRGASKPPQAGAARARATTADAASSRGSASRVTGPPGSGRCGPRGTTAVAAARSPRPCVSTSTTTSGSTQKVPRASTRGTSSANGLSPRASGATSSVSARLGLRRRSRCRPGRGRAARRRSARPRAARPAGRDVPSCGRQPPTTYDSRCRCANFSQCLVRSPARSARSAAC